jgi:hypothetical protein
LILGEAGVPKPNGHRQREREYGKELAHLSSPRGMSTSTEANDPGYGGAGR